VLLLALASVGGVVMVEQALRAGGTVAPAQAAPQTPAKGKAPQDAPVSPQTLLARALKLLADVKDDSTKCYSLALVAVLQAKTGDAPGSAQTFQQARKVVLALPDDYGRVQQLYYLASYQAQAGDSPGALETAREIKERSYKDRILAFIA